MESKLSSPQGDWWSVQLTKACKHVSVHTGVPYNLENAMSSKSSLHTFLCPSFHPQGHFRVSAQLPEFKAWMGHG